MMVAGARVMVVEDNALVAWDIEAMLQEAGYTVLGPLATVAAALAFSTNNGQTPSCWTSIFRTRSATPIATVLKDLGVPFALLTGVDDTAIQGELLHIPRLAKPFGSEDIREMVLLLLELGSVPQSAEQL